LLGLVGDSITLVGRAADDSRREPGDGIVGEDTEIAPQDRGAGVGDGLTSQH
jgi:hypothetical protein